MKENMQIEKTNTMLKVLDWAYEKSINGVPGFSDPIPEFAGSYLKGNGTLHEKVNSLIRWQIGKTSTSGFLTGLGGMITLPVSIPADISTGIYIHMRMISTIAYIGGYDIRDDKVKSLIYLCLVGESVKDILKDAGIAIGGKLALSSLKSVSGKVLLKINRMVGFRLVTKFGEKGTVNLVKIIPVAGGIIGAAVNAMSTNTIGNIARDTFIEPSYNGDITETDQFKNAEDSEIVDIHLLKFYSYINLIKIDGVITKEELEMFENEISHSFLSDSLKLDLISKLSEKEKTEIDYSNFVDRIDDSLELLSNLIRFAKSDNEFHILEKMFIRNVGKQIGFLPEDIEELMNCVGTDKERAHL